MQVMKRLYFANDSSQYGDKCKVYKELQDAHRWRQSGLFIQPGLIQKYLPKGGGAINKSLWNYGVSRECTREDIFIQQQKIIGCTIGVSNVANSLGDEIVSVDILHALYGLGYVGNLVVVYNCPCCGHIDVKGDPQDKKQKDGPREGHYFRALLRRVIPSFLTRWYNRWQQRREYDGAIKALQLGIERLVKNRDDYQRLAWKQEPLLASDNCLSTGQLIDTNEEQPHPRGSIDCDAFDDAARRYTRPEQWSHQKLSKLFPSVDFDKGEGVFQWGGGTSSHIRFFHLRALLEEPALQQEFRVLEVNLLLSGIYGEGFLPILQKGLVNFHLLLSPYKWSVEGRCLAIRATSDDGSDAIETYPLKYVHRESMVVHGAPSLFELSDRFHGGDVVRAGKIELELFPLLSPKRALITLLEQARRKQLSLCGVYGLNQHVIKGEKGTIACRFVTSIAQSGLLARRNVAILFLNEFPLEDWKQLIDQLSLPSSVALRAVSINHLTDDDVVQLSTPYDESKPCLLLINTGPVSDAFFKGIIQCADIFVTEGANSVSQSIKYNTCYLSPISQDSYAVRNYRYLTELPDSRPHTGSARETLLMNLGSQAVRGTIKLMNVGPCFSWDERIDNFIYFSLLVGMEFGMLSRPGAYKRLVFYVKSLLPDARILRFLCHNTTSGYLSIGQVARLLRGQALVQKDCQEILTQILKNEYVPEDSSIKHLFTKLSAASGKHENDIVVGALASLLDVLNALDVD